MFVLADATILHADVDAFFAAVEQRDRPELRGRPVLVGAGIVLSSELRGEGVRRADRDGPSAARFGSAPTRSSCGRACRPTPRRARPCTGCSTTRRRWSKASRSTRHSSTCAGCAGCRLAARDRQAARARCATASACRSRSGSRARSSWPRSQAAWPSRTGCCWCRPTASSSSCTRCRSSGSGASAASPREGSTTRGLATVAPGRRAPRDGLVTMLGRASGRHLHALAHNRDPRPVQTGRRRRSIGAQRRSGGDRLARRGRHVAHRPRRASHRPDAGRGAARPHRHPPAALRRLVARHPLATLPYATANTQTILDAGAELLAGRAAADRAPGDHARRRRRSATSTTTAASSALPFDGSVGDALDAALDEVRYRFGSAAVTRAALLGRRQGLTVPLLPD